jgi:protein-tyrosine phosphatase
MSASAAPDTAPIKVLMVCLGNICRSPTAEGVFRKLVADAGLDACIEVDSAGTSDWHKGEAPDARSIRTAAARGYDLSAQRSRPITPRDFEEYDYIFAMDEQNLRDLHSFCPPHCRKKLGLLLVHSDYDHKEVPDPYSLEQTAFDHVVDLCEHACERLLQQLIRIHALDARVRSQ